MAEAETANKRVNPSDYEYTLSESDSGEKRRERENRRKSTSTLRRARFARETTSTKATAAIPYVATTTCSIPDPPVQPSRTPDCRPVPPSEQGNAKCAACGSLFETVQVHNQASL